MTILGPHSPDIWLVKLENAHIGRLWVLVSSKFPKCWLSNRQTKLAKCTGPYKESLFVKLEDSQCGSEYNLQSQGYRNKVKGQSCVVHSSICMGGWYWHDCMTFRHVNGCSMKTLLTLHIPTLTTYINYTTSDIDQFQQTLIH